jgi:ribosomal protein S18 acetylase RimI-like enzyme
VSDRARALAFLRTIDERASTRVEHLRFGTAYLCPELPTVWARNFVWAEAEIDDGELLELVGEAEDLHARAGLAHRRLVFADPGSGSRAAAALGPAGWRVQGDRVMIYRGFSPPKHDASPVQEVELSALRPLSIAAYSEHPDVRDPETIEHLLRAEELVAGATNARAFAVLVDGAVVSSCRLFSDGSTAQIEDVATLPEFRKRGYSRAVVSRAITAAVESHDLAFLLAADDNWPRHWYERIGFEDAGLLPELLRKG